MYIIDDDNNKKIDCITVLLTRAEIRELLGYAKQLFERAPSSEHYHLSSDDYQKEITICMYDPEKINDLSPMIQKIIKQD